MTPDRCPLRLRQSAGLALFLVLPFGAGAQGVPAPPGAMPATVEQCLSCHGPFGRPDNPEFPIIGGQNAAYIAAALRAYRDGKRSGDLADTMASVAQPLDDRTIDELAAFFSGLRSLR